MGKGLFAFVAALFLGVSLKAAADDVTVFGLRHSIITNALLTTDGPMGPLRVDALANTNVCEDCESNPPVAEPFGISIHLGSANAGVSVSPDAERVDGYAMDAFVYGNSSLAGTSNALAGKISGTRLSWGLYQVDVDYSPMGATNYIYEVYCHGRPVLQLTNGESTSQISTYDVETYPPRINPWGIVIGPAGTRRGCVLDFPSPTHFFFDGGPSTVGDRVCIFPNRNILDGLSRVDVYGRNGLPWFQINQEELGSFDLAHTAIGSVTFQAANNLLTLNDLHDVEADGVAVRLEESEWYYANVIALSLTNDFALVFGARGTSSRSRGGVRLGEVRLQGSNGSITLSADFPDLFAPSNEVRVYSGGFSPSLVGSVTSTSTNPILGSLAGSNIALISYGATATGSNEPATLLFQFQSPVTFIATDGTTLVGDEFRISPIAMDETIGALTQFHLLGGGIDTPLVIDKESFHLKPRPPLAVEVSRLGTNTRVTWPYEPCYYLAAKTNLDDMTWRYVTDTYPLPPPLIVYTNFSYQFDFDLSTAPAQFFQLINNYSYYIRDVW